MTDNRTTELLHKLLEERGIEWRSGLEGVTFVGDWCFVEYENGRLAATCEPVLTPEQAIAATLGKQKAKAHPYGYEPDTGTFDVTRCECGCLNDISATYCNDCGGEIEVDMNAEKEIYHTPRNSVFAVKHDDGSLEFGGKRYVAATLGSGTCEMEYGGDITLDTARVMGVYFCSECGSPIYNDCMPHFCGYCGKAVKR